MSATASPSPRPLHFTALVTSATGHVIQDTWRRPLARQADFDELEHWVRLARTLERARFDAVFFADVVGHSAPWHRDERGPFETGFQTPSSDPSVLAGAIAYVTDHVGIAFTASALQEHPSQFARRISNLDHASKGRVAWNVVADPAPGDWAEEYLDVTYKLWEGSWEDEALVSRSGRAGTPAEYGNVHKINHLGRRYQVTGPHLVSPSPQRTPLLFQAVATEADRALAAQHAEAVFIQSPSLAALAPQTADIRSRAAGHGRLPEDIKFFQSLHVITGGSEAEANRKAAELDERAGYALLLSAGVGATSRIVGTPEQVSDELARWQDAGVDGINLVSAGGPESYEEFVDLVAPVLRERGLMQRDYAEGTLRHKLFGHGDRLPARHPAARYRGAFAPQPALVRWPTTTQNCQARAAASR
jgi:long-chain alkane monooxygenase